MARYARVSGGEKPSSRNANGSSCWGRCMACSGVVAVLLFFLAVASGGPKAATVENDSNGNGNLRSPTTTTTTTTTGMTPGQAHHHASDNDVDSTYARSSDFATDASSRTSSYNTNEDENKDGSNTPASSTTNSGTYFGNGGGGGDAGGDAGNSYGNGNGNNIDNGNAQQNNNNNNNSNGDDNYDNQASEQQVLSDEVDAAAQDLKTAEVQELLVEQSKLSAALSSMGSTIRIGLGRLFGGSAGTVSDADVEDMAQEVYARLNYTMTTELREQADDIRQQQVQEIEGAVDQEQEEGVSAQEIESDVYTHETAAMESITTGIDAVGDELQASMQSRARQIEKEILEDRLSKLLNYKVKLVIVDDEIQGANGKGVDELLNGLQHYQPYNNGQQQQQQQQPQYGQQPQQYGQQPPQYGQQNAYGNNNNGGGYNAANPPPQQNAYGNANNGGYNSGGTQQNAYGNANSGGYNSGGTQYGSTRGTNNNQYAAGDSTGGDQYGARPQQQQQQQQTDVVDLDVSNDNDDY